MSTPNYVTLILDLYDVTGAPIVNGTATITPSVELQDGTDQMQITQAPVHVRFNPPGSPNVSLLATDNEGPQPSGWGYSISFQVAGNPGSFNFFLPYASGATQYLSALTPVASVTTMQAYMPLPTGTAAAGQVPVASGTASASTWETLDTGFLLATKNGVVGNGTTDDTSALNALIQTALSQAEPILIDTPGNMLVSNTIDCRGTGLQIFRTGAQNIVQSNSALPGVLFGDPSGFGQQNLNLGVTYATQATNAAAVAFLGYYPIQSRYNFTSYYAATGLSLYQGAVSSAGANALFSNIISLQFRDFTISGVDTTPYNASNTGNVWDLVVLEIDGSASISGNGLLVANSDNEMFCQLNVGGMTAASASPVLVNGSNVVIDSLHMEGVTFTYWGEPLINVYGESVLTLRGLALQGCSIVGNYDNKGVLGVGDGAEVVLDGLWWGNTNTVTAGGGEFGLMVSLDQTGMMWARGVRPEALSAFSELAPGDTGQLPVLKQCNEQIFHQLNSAGKNILSGSAAPTTGTWAVGDTVWNTAPAAGGAPGWVCTTAGAPGTWTAMASLA